MKSEARITMIQFRDWADERSVIERMERFFGEAAAYGSDLVAFPEYVLGRRVTLDDPRVQRFMALAGEHRMYAVGGLIESLGERWATTALIVGRDGELIGRYIKTHPAAGPGPYWWPPEPGHDDEARGLLGDRFGIFELDFGRVGVLQCYDGYFPEAWACTSYGGAEIVLWINGRGGMVQDAHCISPAQMYACVVGANITDGRNTGFAEPMYGEYIKADGLREESRMFPRIVEPGDAAVHATIDLAALRRLRKHHRMMHQRRPDLYGLLTQDVTMWRNYPEIPWQSAHCDRLVNKSQL